MTLSWYKPCYFSNVNYFVINSLWKIVLKINIFCYFTSLQKEAKHWVYPSTSCQITISLHTNCSHTNVFIKVSNIKFRDTQRNTNIPIQLIDFDNDPYVNTNYALPANEAFILPLTDALKSCEVNRAANQSQQCGLYGNTKYQVSFDILVDDKNLESKSFTFTTGKVNY